MNHIKIKCPAKINLTLEIVNKRNDGFHNIKSIMQMISLYDILDIQVFDGDFEIILSGTSEEIPYNETNLVFKAAKLFFDTTNIKGFKTKIFIEKNIPISAGLAGGSTDAAGTIFGLNELFNQPLSRNELHELCSKLGSDLNVCLEGGCVLATQRGEKIEKLAPIQSSVTLIKPIHLGISAGEAYNKYAQKEFKPKYNMTEKMLQALNTGEDIKEFLYNDLEYAVFDDYAELQTIKNQLPNSIMSGSGSTYFVLDDIDNVVFNSDYQVISGLSFIKNGVEVL